MQEELPHGEEPGGLDEAIPTHAEPQAWVTAHPGWGTSLGTQI